jgi:hypothetical protein
MNSEFEQLLGRYWELAHAEGYTGVSRGDEANEVLHRLREMHKGRGEPVAEVSDWPNDRTPMAILPLVEWDKLPVGTKLYTSAPTIPAALDEFLQKREQDSFSCKQLVADLRVLLAAAPKGETA